jgi:hypothetical protein
MVLSYDCITQPFVFQYVLIISAALLVAICVNRARLERMKAFLQGCIQASVICSLRVMVLIRVH